ncbi:uncharacterized protein LOC121402102 [Xenopus laevis]|uniref:Uncharacterized protein LOC121402102 n=1 Tax=Xenopus laevis TaxID=8355 RepID=A0A8J1MQA6_XENLA|nr:uncharacterized protein LOC121402102 [Xenopus laevis]
MLQWTEEEGTSSFDEDEENYDVIEGELDSRSFIHQMNNNSEYADRRCHGIDTSVQFANEPKPSTAYSHQTNRGGKAYRYVYKNDSQQSVKVSDRRCHNRDATQELHQELHGHQMKGHKYECSGGVPQSTKGPTINRNLKPEKLSFQVKAANLAKVQLWKLNPANDISKPVCSTKRPMKRNGTSQIRESREIDIGSQLQLNECFSRTSEQDTEGVQNFGDRFHKPYFEQCEMRNEDHQWIPPIQNEEAMWGETDHAECNWYVREYDRKKTEQILCQEMKNGAFLVRDSREMTIDQPYVLSVYFQSKVYNIKIRYLEESGQYALGTGLRGNEKFDSVQDIIDFHRRFPVKIIDGKRSSYIHGKECYLTQPPNLNGH